MAKRTVALDIRLCEAYESMESVLYVLVRSREAPALKEDTVGCPLKGIEVRMVGEQGRDVRPGIIGEEISRGPDVFVGYLEDREETGWVLKDDGQFYSGDLCVMDSDGHIRIVGRKKNMVARGRGNLNPNYINDAIEGRPGVVDHAVIGMSDEQPGKRICAYVVPGEGKPPDLGQILAYMREKHTPKRFWPERLELIGRIPRVESRKVEKYLPLEDLK